MNLCQINHLSITMRRLKHICMTYIYTMVKHHYNIDVSKASLTSILVQNHFFFGQKKLCITIKKGGLNVK